MPKILLLILGGGLIWTLSRQSSAALLPRIVNAVPYYPIFQQAALKNNIPITLLIAVADKESKFVATAYNTKSSASGIMQVVPKFHPELQNPFDPGQAIPYAAKYLRKLYDRFGTWKLALAAYNWGEGNLAKYGLAKAPAETRDYYSTILASSRLS